MPAKKKTNLTLGDFTKKPENKKKEKENSIETEQKQYRKIEYVGVSKDFYKLTEADIEQVPLVQLQTWQNQIAEFMQTYESLKEGGSKLLNFSPVFSRENLAYLQLISEKIKQRIMIFAKSKNENKNFVESEKKSEEKISEEMAYDVSDFPFSEESEVGFPVEAKLFYQYAEIKPDKQEEQINPGKQEQSVNIVLDKPSEQLSTNLAQPLPIGNASEPDTKNLQEDIDAKKKVLLQLMRNVQDEKNSEIQKKIEQHKKELRAMENKYEDIKKYIKKREFAKKYENLTAAVQRDISEIQLKINYIVKYYFDVSNFCKITLNSNNEILCQVARQTLPGKARLKKMLIPSVNKIEVAIESEALRLVHQVLFNYAKPDLRVDLLPYAVFDKKSGRKDIFYKIKDLKLEFILEKEDLIAIETAFEFVKKVELGKKTNEHGFTTLSFYLDNLKNQAEILKEKMEYLLKILTGIDDKNLKVFDIYLKGENYIISYADADEVGSYLSVLLEEKMGFIVERDEAQKKDFSSLSLLNQKAILFMNDLQEKLDLESVFICLVKNVTVYNETPSIKFLAQYTLMGYLVAKNFINEINMLFLAANSDDFKNYLKLRPQDTYEQRLSYLNKLKQQPLSLINQYRGKLPSILFLPPAVKYSDIEENLQQQKDAVNLPPPKVWFKF